LIEVRDDFIETDDKDFVSVLRTRGIRCRKRPLIAAGRVKVNFIAPATEDVIRAISDFNDNNAVPIQDFLKASKEIKDQIMAIVRAVKAGPRSVDHRIKKQCG